MQTHVIKKIFNYTVLTVQKANEFKRKEEFMRVLIAPPRVHTAIRMFLGQA